MSDNKNLLNYINARLSLRTPQKDSLVVLDNVINNLDIFTKSSSEVLNGIKQIFPKVTNFGFNFPSLCFALATGVGKTRLMGAMIYYLYKTKGIRNFFVVAPNLTIYEKLRKDFTYDMSNPKYVFRGLGDFDSSNPLVIDGDNYTQISQTLNRGLLSGEFKNKVVINVFNISKFNSRSENVKMKGISEYIGESYFEYLQSLEDLVILTDESHRYKAMRSIESLNELKPLFGLEFTATPFIMSGQKKIPFENVVYEYNLANALRDGYVKTPWVATRENFNPDRRDEDLDYIKVTDGIYCHEETKNRLLIFAKNNGLKVVKPFMMISAIDQAHADRLETLIKSDCFLDGRYKDKVIKVYSNQSGEVKDDMVQKLLEVEKNTNPVEIVIQVMMLKEGWDVNNLYTIVPLRASASDILTEQTIGRGLRLPYGYRTGDEAVDRLTIISHDRYSEIVRLANQPNSLVKNIINLDEIPDLTVKKIVIDSPAIYYDVEKNYEKNNLLNQLVEDKVITKEEGIKVQAVIQETYFDKIENYEYLSSSKELINNSIQEKLIGDTFVSIENNINSIENKNSEVNKVWGILSEDQKGKLVQTSVINLNLSVSENTIDIPRVMVDYGETRVTFDTSYKLNTEFLRQLLFIESNIILQKLGEQKREILEKVQKIRFNGGIKDYLVSLMLDIPEIDYDNYSDWLYLLAEQGEQALVEANPGRIVEELIYMVYNYRERVSIGIGNQIKRNAMTIHQENPKITISKGFNIIKPTYFDVVFNGLLDYRTEIKDKSNIRRYAFEGFFKSVNQKVKFDSDSEKKFSIILENDIEVIKWMKPPQNIFKIGYYLGVDYHNYKPDFVVETNEQKYLVEIKASNEVNDEFVLKKEESAKKWIEAVNQTKIDKKWEYVLIPHNYIQDTNTFRYLISVGRR